MVPDHQDYGRHGSYNSKIPWRLILFIVEIYERLSWLPYWQRGSHLSCSAVKESSKLLIQK